MVTQLIDQQLDLFAQRKPAFDEARANVMLRILSCCTSPIEAGALCLQLGWFGNETGKRKIRRLAEGLKGKVISTNGGYVLTNRATQEQFMDAEGRLRSQIRHMARRVLDMRREWNKRQNNNTKEA